MEISLTSCFSTEFYFYSETSSIAIYRTFYAQRIPILFIHFLIKLKWSFHYDSTHIYIKNTNYVYHNQIKNI